MKIAIVNQSTIFDDREVGGAVAEMMQMHAGLFERFKVDVVFASKRAHHGAPPGDSNAIVFVEDESENPEWGCALLNTNLGIARVFGQTCMETGASVGKVIREQVLGLIGDVSVPDGETAT